MAGVTDSKFLKTMTSYGFNILSLGGYNIDKKTIEAGIKIIGRGRKEFNIPEEDVINHIESEVNEVKNFTDSLVSVNLRAISPDPLIEVSKIKNIDIIEVNCHCRQEEIVSLNCGQGMLSNIQFLEEFLLEIAKKSKSLVSVKIRANVEGVDTIAISKLVDTIGHDFLHIDLMKPGLPYADLELLSKISQETNIFIIGNNMVYNTETAKNMINAGANGFSIARAAMNGQIDFDLNKIKTKTFSIK